MTLKYLLDTSTLSVAIGGKPNRNVLQKLMQRGQGSAIASVVWNELWYGCERLETGRRKAELHAYIQDVVGATFPILAYDKDAARWHGLERARLEQEGRVAPYVDGQIAAIAYVNDLIVVTANVKDFERFKNVAVEDWTKAGRRR